MAIPGDEMSLWWGFPFVFLHILLAVLPVVTPKLWGRFWVYIVNAHTFAVIIALFGYFGFSDMWEVFLNLVVKQYYAFLAIIFALFVISGGIRFTSALALNGSPLHNTILLTAGTVLASVMGTSGATLFFIRPLVSSNRWREHNVHTFIFFIFLVANTGGCLSPLGDPPLFVGFLYGVPFLWFIRHLILPFLFVAGVLLIVYYNVDNYYYRKEDLKHQAAMHSERKVMMVEPDKHEGIAFDAGAHKHAEHRERGLTTDQRRELDAEKAFEEQNEEHTSDEVPLAHSRAVSTFVRGELQPDSGETHHGISDAVTDSDSQPYQLLDDAPAPSQPQSQSHTASAARRRSQDVSSDDSDELEMPLQHFLMKHWPSAGIRLRRWNHQWEVWWQKQHRIRYIDGWRNILLIFACILITLLTGLWEKNGAGQVFGIGDVQYRASDMVRDALLYMTGVLSYLITPRKTRTLNDFSWDPMIEVAVFFLAIFTTMTPVLEILKAGTSGSLGALVDKLSSHGKPIDLAYYWFTGSLSSWLDNTPTFVVFFGLATNSFVNSTDMTETEKVEEMLRNHESTLAAIAAGAVFFGSVTYIGNAPNFFVKNIADANGIKMPSFFGYLLWSFPIMVTTLAVCGEIFFHS